MQIVSLQGGGVAVCNIQFGLYTQFTDFSNGVDFSIFVSQLLNYYIQNSDFVLFFQFCFLIIAIYLCCTTYFPVLHDTHIYWQPLPL